MHHTTFDTFVRRAAGLHVRDRRSVLVGLSAALLATSRLPLGTQAKKKNRKGKRKTKACKKRIKDCRQEVLPGCDQSIDPPGCEKVVNNCCKKACKSVNEARDCLADNL